MFFQTVHSHWHFHGDTELHSSHPYGREVSVYFFHPGYSEFLPEKLAEHLQHPYVILPEYTVSVHYHATGHMLPDPAGSHR